MRIARFPTTMNNTNPTTARRAQTNGRWSLRRRRVVAGAELITEAVAAMYQPYSCRGREGQRVFHPQCQLIEDNVPDRHR